MNKRNIHFNTYINNSKDINSFVVSKFHKFMWKKKLGSKNKYYLDEFNYTLNHEKKAYLEVNIP